MKKEMGLDLGETLSTHAISELQYEIDTEITNLLYRGAPADVVVKFNKRVPVGVSISQHYESFAAKLTQASMTIFKRTQKYRANFVVIAPDLVEILTLLKGFQDTNRTAVGPYQAGTFMGLKVFVSPVIPEGKFVVGYNGGELEAAPALFAPYMGITPTAPIQFPDGGTATGFSTLYDLKMLNDCLLVRGEVVDEAVETETVVGVVNS